MHGGTGEGDATPGPGGGGGGGQWGATPSTTPSGGRKNRWDQTPGESARDGGVTPGWGAETPRDIKMDLAERLMDETPGASKRRSRWDMTPADTPGILLFDSLLVIDYKV
jgi:splicing factor 3B subunit 1